MLHSPPTPRNGGAQWLGIVQLLGSVSLGSTKNAVPSLGLPSYNWRSEANNGLDYFDSKSPRTPHATRTAYPCTTTMAFNRSLYHALGAQVGAEARAMANVGSAAGTWWHPGINLGATKVGKASSHAPP